MNEQSKLIADDNDRCAVAALSEIKTTAQLKQLSKELTEQAFFDEATSGKSLYMYTFSDHKMEKFAELIIRKCADIAKREQASNPQVTVDQCILTEFGL